MAIAPLPLPSPKFGDPSAMETANLKMFDDPYTTKMGGVFMTNLAAHRNANDAMYADAIQKQQGYYDRALQAQADESVLEALPKLLNAQGGTQLLPGVMGVRDILSRLTPGTYEGMAARDISGQMAKTYHEAAQGNYQNIQAGLIPSADVNTQLTGVPTGQGTPLSTTNELIQQAGANARASAERKGSSGITIQPMNIVTPRGTVKVDIKVKPGETIDQAMERAANEHGVPFSAVRPLPQAEGGSGPRDRTQGPTPGFTGTPGNPATSLKPATPSAAPVAKPTQATPDQKAAVQRAIQADGKPTTKGNTIRGIGPDGKEVWIRYK